MRGAAALVALVAVVVAPASASAAASPCASAKAKTLVRNGAGRIVDVDRGVFACTRSRPGGLLLAEPSFEEGDCGSNSSRSEYVVRSGAALAGTFAAVAINSVTRLQVSGATVRWRAGGKARSVALPPA